MKEDNIFTFTGFVTFIARKHRSSWGVRLMSHSIMWFLFTSLLFLDYYLALNISLGQSLFLSVRVLCSSSVVFYLFFYLLLPYIKKYNSIWLIVLAFPMLIILWLIINNSFYVLADLTKYDITNLYPIMGKEKGYKPSLAEVFTFKFIILNTLAVIYSLSPFFFTKIIVDVIRLNESKLRIQKMKSDLEINNINIEKDFLKSQLNPHFLFNTLNNLYALTVKKDDIAPEIILNLSDVIAYTLYESNTDKVSLRKELEFIANYFALERMRYPADKKINLDINVKDEHLLLKIAPLMTFVFLENAFKYGLKNTDDQFVNVFITVEDNHFIFKIENDARQLSSSKLNLDKGYGGIGLVNVQKRLSLLYPDKHTLEIENINEVYKVILNIDLNE